MHIGKVHFRSAHAKVKKVAVSGVVGIDVHICILI